MTPAKGAQRPAVPDYQGFRRDCRAVLKALGIGSVRFKSSATTGEPLVIVETTMPDGRRIDTEKVFNQIYEIADGYGIPAAVVPASYYRYHVG